MFPFLHHVGHVPGTCVGPCVGGNLLLVLVPSTCGSLILLWVIEGRDLLHTTILVCRMNCYVASKLLDDVYMALHVVYARPLPTPIHMILVSGPLAAEIVEGHKSTISTLGAFAAKFAMFAAITVTIPQQTGGGGGGGWTQGHHSY